MGLGSGLETFFRKEKKWRRKGEWKRDNRRKRSGLVIGDFGIYGRLD
jgi:hypothetical protein